MMQAFEEEMTTLRRAIRQWLTKMGWRKEGYVSPLGRSLGDELGVPADIVSRVLDRTAADLRALSEGEDDAPDARPIINRAIHELAKYGYHSRPFEEATMERYLNQLPDLDLQILRYFKQGKKHREIAALLGMDIESVRRSLVNTYADLRMKMMSSGGSGGNALPAGERQRARSFN